MGAGGGVGLAAVEIAKAMGARVVAAASSDEKLELAHDRGADDLLVYPHTLIGKAEQKSFAAQLKKAAGPAGFDVVYDPVGAGYSEPAFRAIAWQGRHLVVGFAAGMIPSIPLNLPLLKGAQIVGVIWGTAAMHDATLRPRMQRELLDMLVQGQIRPHIGAVLDLAHSATGLKMLAERRAMGKIIVRC
jgi:NADPH2:quinone reductase